MKSGTADRPIRFTAAPAARVIVDGTDVITGSARRGSKRRADLQRGVAARVHRLVENPDPPGRRSSSPDRSSRAGVRPGLPPPPGSAPGSHGRGTFFVDEEARRLFVWGSANEDLNQAPGRGLRAVDVWDGRGDHVHLRGVRFRHAANAAQQAAAQFHGRGDVVEDCVFEQTNSCGAAFLGPIRSSAAARFKTTDSWAGARTGPTTCSSPTASRVGTTPRTSIAAGKPEATRSA